MDAVLLNSKLLEHSPFTASIWAWSYWVQLSVTYTFKKTQRTSEYVDGWETMYVQMHLQMGDKLKGKKIPVTLM